MSLSGIGKIYNATKYMFPLEFSIQSVLSGADEFVLVVCEDSQDDTVKVCQDLETKFDGKLKLVYSKWIVDKDEGKHNMRRLANTAIENIKNDWFLSVDMDEVYRPGEVESLIRQLKILSSEHGGATVNFVHLYKDPYHRIFGKLYDRSARVGRRSKKWTSYDDGFGLVGEGHVYMSSSTCNHYGFVRPAKIGIEKELSFQETLYKPLHTEFPDPRLIELNEVKDLVTEDEFYNRMMGERDFIVNYKGTHWPGVTEWWRDLK